MIIAARIAVILGLLVGGTGATAVAAQSSEPADLLYPVKLAAENLRLTLTRDAQTEIELLLDMVDERVEEIHVLTAEGRPVPVSVSTRLQNQLELVLQRAAELDDPSLIQAMEQIQVRTQEHIQRFQQTRENAAEDAEEVLQLAEQIIATVRVQAQDALEDPTTFRLRLNTERPEDAPVQPLQTPGQGDGEAGNGDGQDCEPVPGEGKDCVPAGTDPQGQGKQRGKDQ